MKHTKIIRVQTGNRVAEFCNASAAQRYRRKWGGTILAANEPAAISGAGSQSQSPIVNPFTASLLGLPFNATRTEYEAAWQANGGQSATLNTAAVRDALIALAMREQNFARARAADYVRQRCPNLFNDTLAKASGVNERLACNEVLAIGPVLKFRL